MSELACGKPESKPFLLTGADGSYKNKNNWSKTGSWPDKTASMGNLGSFL